MTDLRTRCMQFLYKWVSEGKLSNMRKGQVEELEAFVSNELSSRELARSAAMMQAQQEKAAQEPQGESKDA